ncbi:MAG: Nif3-like dinuclear metal center hexameric protein [Planctomycetota bacterium]
MKAKEITDFIFEIAPNPDHAWENEYLFGNEDMEVKGVAVAWWLTLDIVEKMEELGLTYGVSHERIYHHLPERFVWGTLPEENELSTNVRLKEVTEKNNMAIHQFHSNIDKAGWGMPHALLESLGWQDYPADWSRGVPVIDIPEIKLKDFVSELKGRLDVPFIRYDGDDNRTIKRIALAWGGLCQSYSGLACPLPLGIDAVIGGDIIDGVVRLARSEDVAVIDAWHHRTEMDAMRVCAEKLRERFPELNVEYFENDDPWKLG